MIKIWELKQVPASLVLWCFTDTASVTNGRFMATLHQATLSVPFFFFFQHLLTLCLYVTFW